MTKKFGKAVPFNHRCVKEKIEGRMGTTPRLEEHIEGNGGHL